MRPFAAGYELTFTSETLIRAGRARGELELDTPENIAAAAAFAAAFRTSIGDHAYAVEDDGCGFARHVITLPDGYWIKIEIDPWCVEVIGLHASVERYREIAPRMEQLFPAAASLGLAPHERIGGGHIHLDRGAFSTERDIRNFIVDYANHPELALGILGFDPLNATPLACAPPASIAAFVESLARFDRGELDLAGFLEHLQTQVYTYGAPDLPPTAHRAKYQALSVANPNTIEIRALRPQQSFAELIARAEMFERRVRFLDGRPPLPYRAETWPAACMPPSLARDRYLTYLAEMNC